MIFTIKYIRNEFYNKNTFGMNFSIKYIKNVFLIIKYVSNDFYWNIH